MKERILDLDGARRRVLECFKATDYCPITNNCEYFVSYVARGERESPQLFACTATASLLGAGFVVFKLAKRIFRLLR